MFPISAAMRTALSGPHAAVFKAELYDSGTLVQTLDVLAGNVEVDGSADRRRRCRVALADVDGTLTPADLTGLLAPNGNDLRLYRGVRHLDGTDDWCPLGVFGIAEVAVRDLGGGVLLDVTAYDRSRKVSRARWEQGYAIDPGTNVGTAVRDIVDSRLPGLSYAFTPTSRTTPLVILGEQRDNDPWKDATTLAQSIGFELYFDAQGVCVLRPVPDVATAPITWEYVEGEGGLLLSIERQLSDERTYNAVVVSGEGSSIAQPFAVMVADTDPTSPTYVGNPVGSSDFGFVPRFLTSPLITSTAQAGEAGLAMLRQSLGVTEDVRFTGIVNPAHDAGDVVRIVRGAAKVDALFVLQAFTIPLDVTSPLQAVTRRRET